MSGRFVGLIVGAVGACALAVGATQAQETGAPLEACTAPRCLGVAFSPELEAALATPGAVDLAALAGGLVYTHTGEPLDVRLIVARYDDNRLVRYGVSARVSVGADAEFVIPDAAATVEKALRPATNRTLEIETFEGALDPSTPIQVKSFVGNLPPTNLVGEEGSGLIPASAATEAATHGSMGVLVLEPDSAELRDGAGAQTLAALVRLQLKRP